MNEAIRRTWTVMVAMFLVLAAAASVIQVVAADRLKQNPLNSRQIFLEFGAPRGPILVDGEPIAESVESDDAFTYQRVYHDTALYAPLTGFYSLTYGTEGLEKAMNEQLAGTPTSQFMDRAVEIITGATAEGDQVELTIDPEAQRAAYAALPEGVRGSVVVTDPETGEILAMASRPGFDSNALSSHTRAKAQEAMSALEAIPGASAYRNRPSEQTVSPGSTFKLIDAVAMLESGDYAPDDVLDVPARWTLPGTSAQMGNYDGGQCDGIEKATLTTIMAQSCNTPFAMAAVELGEDAIRDTAERFGFNEEGSMPLPIAASRFPEDLDDASLAQSAIGQRDVQATALQMTMVAAGIANEGMVMEPQLVRAVRRPDLTTVEEFSPREHGRGTDADVARQITGMMEEVVRSGTATGAASDRMRIAAKTGTAEIGDSENVHSWITGFAPAQDPQVAVTIVIEDVDTSFGHRTVVEGMKSIMEAVVAE
ncbi:penicillin-binding transpeptidase domain-containing protein [Micrococcus sp. 2A]|uniref:peptidoglycan D,D-transpeptidase FtsI family protein n=1 Tax=Micrococcus TaxID=1269 RepID=UPI002004C6D9|nr:MULTISPECIES: penicillin-binding transpeptidase domain-containing protein [unclassified Micrococcus]MCK6095537.1 penicillin-binding protein 2 [Micrococcus sp. EYE_212]MCK6171612.1 penicillin-binding protein 2 [Micrococcus sp. EYE_162]MDX2341502.1 penicillin-binding transpeptidase domain-containing protein [Micrococcus sp. M4NT]